MQLIFSQNLFQNHFFICLLLIGLLGGLVGKLLNKLGFYLPAIIYKDYLFDGIKSTPSTSQHASKLANLIMIFLASGLPMLIFHHFGYRLITFLFILFSYFLLLLSHIDYYHYLLPDCIVFPLLWLGLLLNAENLITTPTDAILAAIIGYLILWTVGFIYSSIRQKEGVGHGDMKLLAALGAWLGTKALLPILLVACSLGVLIGLFATIYIKPNRNMPMPFAPFLALGSLVVVIVGYPL